MPDIFDEIEVAEPGGDIFDDVSPEAGDILDEIEPVPEPKPPPLAASVPWLIPREPAPSLTPVPAGMAESVLARPEGAPAKVRTPEIQSKLDEAKRQMEELRSEGFFASAEEQATDIASRLVQTVAEMRPDIALSMAREAVGLKPAVSPEQMESAIRFMSPFQAPAGSFIAGAEKEAAPILSGFTAPEVPLTMMLGMKGLPIPIRAAPTATFLPGMTEAAVGGAAGLATAETPEEAGRAAVQLGVGATGTLGLARHLAKLAPLMPPPPDIPGTAIRMPRGTRLEPPAPPELVPPDVARIQAERMTREATAAFEPRGLEPPTVPETPAEPYETLLSEARRKGLNTVQKVLDEFPSLEGNREKAREIRNAAFPETVKAPEAPAAIAQAPQEIVRLYHGEGGVEGAGVGGSWFTENPQRAATFGPNVTFVDVPKSVADAARQAIKSDYVLPNEWVKKAAPVVEPVKPQVWDLDEPVKTRTLTPAIIADEGGAIETATDHGTARLQHARKGNIAVDLNKEGFIDETGKFLTREQAAQRFFEITGKRPFNAERLTSEDLKANKMLGHLEKPAEKAAAAKPYPTTAEAVFKASPEEMLAIPFDMDYVTKLAESMTDKQLQQAEKFILDLLKRQAESKRRLDAGEIDIQQHINNIMAKGDKGKVFQDVFAHLNRPIPELPGETAFNPAQVATVEFPVEQIIVNKDVPQFKEGADPKTGVVPEDALDAAKYERVGTAPVVLWQKANGETEIITGRNRLDLARRTGEKTIPAQVVREADGFTRDMALTFDAEANIRDGQGTLRDYAHYFRNSPALDEATARARGLLSRAKGQAGWQLGKVASDDLYAKWRMGKINDARAVAIARAAGPDVAKQQLGIKLAEQGKPADYIRARLERERAKAEATVQTDMFGNSVFDDTKADAEAQRVAEIRRELESNIKAAQNAARDPESAKRAGIDVKDPQGTLAKVAEWKAELEKWNGAWWLDPELVRKATGKETAPKTTPPAAPPPPTTPTETPAGEPVKPPVVPPEAPKPFFLPEEQARVNTLFERLKAKRGQVSVGVDPELFTIGGELAYHYLKGGVRRFNDFATHMIRDLGDWAKDYLLAWYNNARLNLRNIANELDDEATAQRAYQERFGKPAPGGPEIPGSVRGGGEPGGRPGVRVARPELIPVPQQHVGTDSYAARSGFRLDEEQVRGVNLVLDRFLSTPKGSFVLADGPGFGKTAQQLAVADQYIRIFSKPSISWQDRARELYDNSDWEARTRWLGGDEPTARKAAAGAIHFDELNRGQKLVVAKNLGIDTSHAGKTAARPSILLITQNKQVAETRFGADAERMGIDLGKIVRTTYTSLGKLAQRDFDLVIFDESHNLKNSDALKTIAAARITAKHKLFATATPMDRPTGAAYFLSEITGQTPDQIAHALGYTFQERVDPLTQEPYRSAVLLPGMNWPKVWANIMAYRDASVRGGALIRREYPFYGEVGAETIPMTFTAKMEQERIIKHYDALIKKNKYDKRNLSGQKTLTLSRWAEQQKLERAVQMAVEHIRKGGQAVIVAETDKAQFFPIEIKGAKPGTHKTSGKSGWFVEGALTQIEKMLAAQGVTDIAHIHDPKSRSLAVEVRGFQSGKKRIGLATPQSGGTGIDLDDQVGNAPRLAIILSKNFAGDAFEQLVGRFSRKHSKSPAVVKFLDLADSYADARRNEVLAHKIQTLRAIQGGEELDVAGGFEAGEGTVRPGGGLGAGPGAASPAEFAERQAGANRVPPPPNPPVATEPGQMPTPEVVRRNRDYHIFNRINSPQWLFYFGRLGETAKRAWQAMVLGEFRMRESVRQDINDFVIETLQALPRAMRKQGGQALFDILDGRRMDQIEAEWSGRPGGAEVIAQAERVKTRLEEIRTTIRDIKRDSFKRYLMGLHKDTLVDLFKQNIGEAVEVGKLTKRDMADALSMDQFPDDWGIADGSYLPHLFFGQWKVTARLPGQEESAFVARAQTIQEAKSRVYEMTRANPDMAKADFVIAQDTVIPADMVRLGDRRFWNLVQRMKAQNMEPDAVKDALRGNIGRKAAKQKWWGSLKHREGYAGYSQDYGRVMTSYLNGFHRWRILTDLNRRVQPMIEQVRAEGRINAADRLEAIFNNLWGKPPESTRQFDALIHRIPVLRDWVKPLALDRWSRFATQLAGMLTLRTLRFSVVNRLQPLQGLYPLVGERGIVEAKRLQHTAEGRQLLKDAGVDLDPGQYAHELAVTGARRALVERFSGERSNQELAFLAMYRHARRLGMDHRRSVQYGKLRGQLMTQFTPLTVDTPELFEGPFGRLMFQFKRFPVKQVELMSQMVADRNVPALARLVGAFAVLGGLSFLLRQTWVSRRDDRLRMKRALDRELGAKAADVVMYGLPGLAGADISGSITLGDEPMGQNIYEKTARMISGPAVSLGIEAARTAAAAARKPTTPVQDAETMLRRFPTARPLAELSALLRGDLDLRTPDGQTKLRRKTTDALMGLGSFRSANEANISLAVNGVMALGAEESRLKNDWYVARDKAAARKDIAAFNLMWPEAAITAEDLNRYRKYRETAGKQTAAAKAAGRRYEKLIPAEQRARRR